MDEIYINCKKSEYFCKKCHQLRLSLKDDKSCCGNCGSADIIVGDCGTLDKEALLKEWTEPDCSVHDNCPLVLECDRLNIIAELQAENEKLESRIKKMTVNGLSPESRLSGFSMIADKQIDRVKELCAENKKLQMLLGLHGRHSFRCDQAADPKKDCTCGWSKVFEEYLPCQPTP